MSPEPLEACTLGARGNGYAAPKTSLFLVDRAGTSDLSIHGTHSDSDSIYPSCTLTEYPQSPLLSCGKIISIPVIFY